MPAAADREQPHRAGVSGGRLLLGGAGLIAGLFLFRRRRTVASS